MQQTLLIHRIPYHSFAYLLKGHCDNPHTSQHTSHVHSQSTLNKGKRYYTTGSICTPVSLSSYAQYNSTVLFTIFFDCCLYVFVMNGTGDVHFDGQENKNGCGWMPLQHKQTISFFLKKNNDEIGGSIKASNQRA